VGFFQEAAPSGASGTGANGNNDQHTEEANNAAKSNSARKTVLALDLRPYMNRAPLTVCTTAILFRLQTSSFHNFLPSPIPVAMSQFSSFIQFFIPILPFSFI